MKRLFYIIMGCIVITLSACASIGKKNASIPEVYFEYVKADTFTDFSIFTEYALVNIDDDDVPEIILRSNLGESFGYYVLSLQQDSIYELLTERLYFMWIERSGLCGYENGSMGHYYSRIFRLDKKGFTKIVDWDWEETGHLMDDGTIIQPKRTLNSKDATDEEAQKLLDKQFFSKGKVLSVDSLQWLKIDSVS